MLSLPRVFSLLYICCLFSLSTFLYPFLPFPSSSQVYRARIKARTCSGFSALRPLLSPLACLSLAFSVTDSRLTCSSALHPLQRDHPKLNPSDECKTLSLSLNREKTVKRSKHAALTPSLPRPSAKLTQNEI